MKKITISLIFLLLLSAVLFTEEGKIPLQRISRDSISIENLEKRVHPYQEYFNQRKAEYQPNKRSRNFNRLLVILVEFQEDDNPNTTTNGKFQTEYDPSYPITVASPPYNRQFFEAQLEAMKYYYRAVSYESFQLDYEVYPKTGAYQLPRELGYYNPLDDNLFIERIEQYFQDAWTTAYNSDDKPDYFGDFEHFMIIHAGSSWQHDTRRDTPQDMPSFFINVADGKEVIVDGGATMIKTSANVPETITQDIQTYRTADGESIVVGYGVVNSVFAHEFGHSLGFADLYNTFNGRPAVGTFCIMDSGGSTSIVATKIDNVFYVVEGLFPALPSPWSRLLVFEEYFLANSILVDVSLYSGEPIRILASSARRSFAEELTPYFYRLRLSETEYLLIENRNVDPDGDGGTSLVSALNGRVALHPAPFIGTNFTYEYDNLLPCFEERIIPAFGDPYIDIHGGGLLIWHIDDDKIYNQGITIDGHFYNNYEQNRVNVSGRGVQIIEADGLEDIGNVYSRFWTGTPYEYFYKYKPIINSEGYFEGWSDEIHNDNISANTHPALTTVSGRPSSWKIYDISGVARVMTFQLSNSMFDFTATIDNFNNLHSIFNYPNSDINQISTISSDAMFFFNSNLPPSMRGAGGSHNINVAGGSHWDFTHIDDTINTKPDFIATYKNTSILVYNNEIIFTDDKGIKMSFLPRENSRIIEQPLIFNMSNTDYMILVYEDELPELYTLAYDLFEGMLWVNYLDTFPYSGKFITDGEFVYLLTENTINKIRLELSDNIKDPVDIIFESSFSLQEKFTIFDPVAFKHLDKSIAYFMSDTYKIFSFTNDELKQIFDLKRYDNGKPSQLALGYTVHNASNFILLHTDTTVYIISEDGSFYPNFPRKLTDYKLNSDSVPYVFNLNDEVFVMLHDSAQGYIGIDLKGKIRTDLSQYWNQGDIDPVFFIDVAKDYLYMIYADEAGTVFSAAKTIKENDKILWNGFRNAASGALIRTDEFKPIESPDPIEIFVYPNPIRQDIANIKINNTSSPAKIRVYTISGQLIFSNDVPKSYEMFRDIQLDTYRFSSGVYFVNVEIDGKSYRDKFAIIK